MFTMYYNVPEDLAYNVLIEVPILEANGRLILETDVLTDLSPELVEALQALPHKTID